MPFSRALGLGLKLGLGENFGLEVVDGDAGEGDGEAEGAGDDALGDRNALPLCLTPNVSAALAFP